MSLKDAKPYAITFAIVVVAVIAALALNNRVSAVKKITRTA